MSQLIRRIVHFCVVCHKRGRITGAETCGFCAPRTENANEGAK